MVSLLIQINSLCVILSFIQSGISGVLAVGDCPCDVSIPQEESPSETPSQSQRETRLVSGWKVHVSQQLIDRDKEAVDKAIGLLKKQLDEVIRVVPKQAVKELQKVPLYFSDEYPGVGPRAEFHPGEEWLRDNGRDPAMVRSVEFTNIRIFEEEMDRMPNFALHELAHAYHFRFLKDGYGNAEIMAVYDRAKQSGGYDRVERRLGGDRPNQFEAAYGISNPPEYFAETTEAYFSRNDFFPFNRAELRKHDPEMHDLLKELWNP
ncbi:MAG: hypothetical protein JNL58_11220 [Planctomyces sp.]|nr:hypothetical protein [Planctomyces sp.]